MAEWLIGTGVSIRAVQSMVESHLADVILKNFDPKRADLIFLQQTEGEIDWLPELISHAPWRSLVYKLSEEYPDCLMLNFALKVFN